jgi:two-component system C4-dicarboxylate transport sensor histidine kinase DctB
MGLGLAISASIISEHGGEIEAGDNDSAGAWFQITLPVAPEPQNKDKVQEEEDMVI